MSSERSRAETILPSQLAIAVLPHLIPAVTLPSGAIERAMSEPLATGRDEVVYLVCSHPRVAVGERQDDGSYPIHLAWGDASGGIEWNRSAWWGRIWLPEHASPSRIPWAILDSALDWEERLPLVEGDFSDDPDGEAGQNRQELLPWVYDRHLELTHPPNVDRGHVDGGHIEAPGRVRGQQWPGGAPAAGWCPSPAANDSRSDLAL